MPKPKRRWYQYTLRTLLAVMLLCALACSWYADRVEQARRQGEAVRLLGEGEFAIYDYQFDAVGDMLEDAKPATPQWLQDWWGTDFFHRVVVIHVNRRESLQRVGKLRWLEELYVSCETTDADLVHFQGLKRLKRLDLCRSRITEEGAKELQKALPRCQIDW